MYEVPCFFCGTLITSAYWDEIQEHLDRCFAQASPKEQGRVGHVAEAPTITTEDLAYHRRF